MDVLAHEGDRPRDLDLHTIENHDAFRADYGHQRGLENARPTTFRDRTHLLDVLGFFSRYVFFSDFRTPPTLAVEGVVPDLRPMLRNLGEIVTLARSRGQKPVLCTEPNRFRMDVPEEARRKGEMALRNFGERISAALIPMVRPPDADPE